MTGSSRSKNVGEWSELYALAYLLANGGGHAADEFNNPVPSIFYKVLMAMFENGIAGADLIYQIESGHIAIYADSVRKGSIAQSALMKKAMALHADLRTNPPGRAFPSVSGDDLLRTLMKSSVAASSKQRDDILLTLEDRKTGMPSPWIGFSIKSQLNAKATLVNASPATNFVFEIVPAGRAPSRPIPKFGESLKDDMQLLVKYGYTLKFLDIDGAIHRQNMDLVDSNLAGYMAKCLFETTQHRNNGFADIVELVFPRSDKESAAKVFKLKQYLGYVMLGMKPATRWDGQPSAFGGLILVKLSGDVLFYYLYNMKAFQDFLFKNLKFEYGMRSRHGYGKPFKRDGKTLIKLNLQLRFK